MRYTYTSSQWLPNAIPRVFAFFADPANLPRLMPGWQKARIDSLTLVPPPPPPNAETTNAAGAGTRMTISFRPIPLSPIRLRWDAQIAEFAWHDHFCDIQLRRGPFAYWKHCHRIRPETRDNIPGTLLTDHVDYELPFAPFSALAHPLFRLQIRSIFRFRHRRTAELLAYRP